MKSALLARSIVADDDKDQGIVEQVRFLEIVYQPTYRKICICQIPGIDLHKAGVEVTLVGRQGRPSRDIGIAIGEESARGNDAHPPLICKHALAKDVPAVIKLPLVLVA